MFHSSSANLIQSLCDLIERSVPDLDAREKAISSLRQLESATWRTALDSTAGIAIAEAGSIDRWTSRARPTFLYVMYAMMLWALPIGIIAAISPAVAHAIVTGTTSYLAALPEPLYTFFGTGYLGYATLRQLGKVKGTDR